MKREKKLARRNVGSSRNCTLRREEIFREGVIVRGYDDLWQADIVEMRPYSSFNTGYILTVIDVLSKYAWAVPLESKGGSETANAIAEIVRESERCPKNLQIWIWGKNFTMQMYRIS